MCATFCLAQNKPSKSIGSQGQVNNMVSAPLPGDSCLNKKFSLIFYIIEDSLNPISTASLASINTTLVAPRVNFLNNAFRPICVSFEHCRTVIIPNFEMNIWDLDCEAEAKANYYADKTINVYMVGKDILNKECPDGYTYRPDAASATSRKDMIVCSLGASGASDIHLMGHFMGLPHTGENRDNNPGPAASTNSAVLSKELVNRSNCYFQGDGFCDTEADPYPITSAPAPNIQLSFRRDICNFNGNLVDVNGDFYTPPTDNYMSYYRCACRFTQEQYNYMVKMILRYRMYLH